MQVSDAEKIVSLVSSQDCESPFSVKVLQFCQNLSDVLLKDKKFRNHGELVALGFWIRMSHLEQLKQSYQLGDKLLRPRGITFHITPGNVDVMFAYSWILSFLTGNSNIVRLSSKNHEVQTLLLEVINDLLSRPEFKSIQNKNYFINYGYDSGLTEYFSSICDVRVIWGGDNTIDKIRQSEIQATAKEIVFADRFSFALVDAETINRTDELIDVINAFKKDVFIYGQQACSSPRLIVWLGEQSAITKAKTRFWNEFDRQIQAFQKSNEITASELFDKTVVSQYLAMQGDTVDLSLAPYVHRIQLKHLDTNIQRLHCGNGLVYEISIKTLEELSGITNKHFQTCSFYGIEPEDIKHLIIHGRLNNIYRYVPIGKALDFDSYWDGMDLLYEFSKVITV